MRLSRAVVWVAGIAACVPDARLPDGAQVTCATDADCPATHLCVAAIERCVQRDGRDETPPDVVEDSIDVAPTRVVLGATLTVRFIATEALFAPPIVRAQTLTNLVELDVRAGEATREWVAMLEATDDVEESAVNLAVSLIDTSGNTRDRLLRANAAIFDFTAPALVGTPALQIDPAPGTLTSTVTAVGVGAIANVSFATTEPLAEDTASVILRSNFGSAVTLAAQVVATSASLYDVVIDPAAAELGDATYTVLVRLIDSAGNGTDDDPTALGLTLVVDRTPPALAPAGLVLERAPWGAPPSIVLRGLDPSALEPGSVAFVWDAEATTDELFEVTHGPIADPLPLGARDVDRAWVTIVDAAGNADEDTALGAPLEVPTIRFLVEANGRVVGSDDANPHVVATTARFETTRAQPDAIEHAGDVVGAADAVVLSAEARGAWRQLSGPSDAPQLFIGALVASAVDHARGRLVIAKEQQTFAWDGERMTTLAVDGPVGAAGFGSLAYDAARDRALFLSTDALLSFDGVNWSQADVVAGFNSGSSFLVYDEARDQTLIVKPETGNVAVWSGLAPASVVPGVFEPLHGDVAACYDPDEEAILFVRSPDPVLYRLDVDPLQATVLHDASGAAPDMKRADLTFQTQLVCRGGGRYAALDGAGRVWAFQDGAWLKLTNVTPLQAIGLSADPVRDELLALVSVDSEVLVARVDDTALHVLGPGHNKPTGCARCGHSASIDPGLGTIGFLADNGSDVWTWIGGAFVSAGFLPGFQPTIEPSFFVGTASPLVGYASDGDDQVLAYQFEDNALPWTLLATHTMPSNAIAAVARDDAVSVLTLLPSIEHCTTAPGSCVSVTPIGPAPTDTVFVATDLATNQAILYQPPLVFTWDVATDTLSVVDAGLDAPSPSAMSFDPFRRRAVVLDPLATLWEWNGASFDALQPATNAAPAARSGALFEFEFRRGAAVLFGGTIGGSTPLEDQWRWESPAVSRPAVLFTVNAAESGLLVSKKLAAIRVTTTATASGSAVQVLVFARGRWRPLLDDGSVPDTWLSSAVEGGRLRIAVSSADTLGEAAIRRIDVDELHVELTFQ